MIRLIELIDQKISLSLSSFFHINDPTCWSPVFLLSWLIVSIIIFTDMICLFVVIYSSFSFTLCSLSLSLTNTHTHIHTYKEERVRNVASECGYFWYFCRATLNTSVLERKSALVVFRVLGERKVIDYSQTQLVFPMSSLLGNDRAALCQADKQSESEAHSHSTHSPDFSFAVVQLSE